MKPDCEPSGKAEYLSKDEEPSTRGLLATQASPCNQDTQEQAESGPVGKQAVPSHGTTWYTDETGEIGKLDDDTEFPPLTLPSD